MPLSPPEPPPSEPRRPRPGTPSANHVRQRTISARVGPRAPLPDTTISSRENPTPPSPPEPQPPEPRWPRPDAPATNCARQRVTSTSTNSRAPLPEETTYIRQNLMPQPPLEPSPSEPRRSRPGMSAATARGRVPQTPTRTHAHHPSN